MIGVIGLEMIIDCSWLIDKSLVIRIKSVRVLICLTMGFETQYLKSTIGDILSEGLTEVLVTKPHDPVQFLGQWLLMYAM